MYAFDPSLSFTFFPLIPALLTLQSSLLQNCLEAALSHLSPDPPPIAQLSSLPRWSKGGRVESCIWNSSDLKTSRSLNIKDAESLVTCCQKESDKDNIYRNLQCACHASWEQHGLGLGSPSSTITSPFLLAHSPHLAESPPGHPLTNRDSVSARSLECLSSNAGKSQCL